MLSPGFGDRSSCCSVGCSGKNSTEERVLGLQHPDTVTTIGNLAEVLSDEGRLAESQKLYQQALLVTTRTLVPTIQPHCATNRISGNRSSSKVILPMRRNCKTQR
jgi:Tetratricopeptide repeat